MEVGRLGHTLRYLIQPIVVPDHILYGSIGAVGILLKRRPKQAVSIPVRFIGSMSINGHLIVAHVAELLHSVSWRWRLVSLIIIHTIMIHGKLKHLKLYRILSAPFLL